MNSFHHTLTVNMKRAAVSGSCCCDFLAVTDPWKSKTKANPFSTKLLFVRVFYHTNGNQTRAAGELIWLVILLSLL